MKILFLGDSITAGCSAGTKHTDFVSLLAERTYFECFNYGESGTQITPVDVRDPNHLELEHDFIRRAKTMPKDADLVFVFGGTNDFAHNAPVGKETDRTTDSLYGSLHILYSYLTDTYGKDAVKIILPLHRFDENMHESEFMYGRTPDSANLDVYVNAIREVAASYGLAVLDFRDVVGIVRADEKDMNPYISSDGLHPNDKGHALLCDLIWDWLVDNGYTRYRKTASINDLLKDDDFAPYNKYLFYRWNPSTFDNWMYDVNIMTFEGVNKLYELKKQGLTDIYYLEESNKVGRKDINIIHLKHNDNRKAAFVAAGGGYDAVCTAMESLPIGEYLYKRGYDVFLLTYGVQEEAAGNMPVFDMANAVRYVLDHEKELNVDMSDYAVIGSSAAGYLAAQFGTENRGYRHFGLPKPGVLGLQYPVVTAGTVSHSQTRDYALGALKDDQAARDEYSTEKHVDKDYPSTFIVRASRDGCVDEANSEMLKEQLIKNGIKYSWNIYPYSGHGWGRGFNPSFEGWVENFISFWKSCYTK